MHIDITLFGLTIPAYGCMIASGVIMANIFAMFVLKRTKQDLNDFIILEAFCILGAFLGAKGLYLAVSSRQIQWSRLTDFAYFNQLMQGGFVFYGGLIGGLLCVIGAGKIYKMDYMSYIRNFIFLIPLIHGFGRIGCFLAGCCYGKPYHGPGAVVFPEGSYAPAGIELFPVQLMEAAMLFLIFFVLLWLEIRKSWKYTIETYFVLYGITRFILEFLRYDTIRGVYAGLATSQWIILLVIAGACISLAYRWKNRIMISK